MDRKQDVTTQLTSNRLPLHPALLEPWASTQVKHVFQAARDWMPGSFGQGLCMKLHEGLKDDRPVGSTKLGSSPSRVHLTVMCLSYHHTSWQGVDASAGMLDARMLCVLWSLLQHQDQQSAPSARHEYRMHWRGLKKSDARPSTKALQSCPSRSCWRHSAHCL